MYIVTERMILRDFCLSDAADLHEILGDAETMRYCEPAYDLECTQNFLRDFCIAKKGAVAAVHKDSQKVIGYILFHAWEASVYEMGWIFHKNFWRQGYAYEACAKIISCAFETLSIQKIVAETIDTQKSVGLMKKLGMALQSVQKGAAKDMDGKPADLYLYEITRE